MRKWLALQLALCFVMAGVPSSAEGLRLLPADQFANWYYANPSGIRDIGDPQIFFAEGAYWCVATSSAFGYRIWRSEDLVNWDCQEAPAYSRSKESWSRGNFWAPEVYPYKGRYYLFYSARCKGKWDGMRIGIAAADHPEGPYVDLAPEPLFDPGYSVIDASFFVDSDGTPYLFYARDCSENVVDGVHESHVYGVRLRDDLSAPAGEPVALTRPDQTWEQDSGPEWLWNEGPIVLKNGDQYHLFYSANYYASKEYGVGCAVSKSPLGPYVKNSGNPLMRFMEREGETIVSGPGHNSFLTTQAGDETFIVYHTHADPKLAGDDRQMCLDRMGFLADGIPYVNGPTLYPQLKPLEMIGMVSLLPQAVADHEAAECLREGDYGISPLGGLDGRSFQGEATFRWSEPVSVQALLIYPAPGALGECSLSLGDGRTLTFELSELEKLPGACFRFYFEPVSATEVSIRTDGAVCEVIALGAQP